MANETHNFPSYTADNLISLRVSAVRAVRNGLASERAYYAEGMANGYLSDSSFDNLTWGDLTVDQLTFTATSIRSGYAVCVRVEDDSTIIDYVATPVWGSRPWIPSGWTFQAEITFDKDRG